MGNRKIHPVRIPQKQDAFEDNEMESREMKSSMIDATIGLLGGLIHGKKHNSVGIGIFT